MNQFNSPYHSLNMPDIGEYITNNPSIINSIIQKRADMYRKWSPVIEGGFKDIKINDETISDICIYCEVCSTYYDTLRNAGFTLHGNELSGVLSTIRENILAKAPERVGIIRKVYNYNTGFMEYELEDGQFVKIVNESVIGPKVDIDRDIFCEPFLKHIDPSSYRNKTIDKLI